MHLVGGPLMVAFFIGHGTNQRDILHDLRSVDPVFGNLNSGNRRFDRLFVTGA